MSHQTNDFLLTIRRYFCSLWAALKGRGLYLEKYEELSERVEHAYSELYSLRGMYDSALNKWEQSQNANKQMELQNQKLQKDVESYRTLVETLRGSIRDKEKELEGLRREYRTLLGQMNVKKVKGI